VNVLVEPGLTVVCPLKLREVALEEDPL